MYMWVKLPKEELMHASDSKTKIQAWEQVKAFNKHLLFIPKRRQRD